MNEPKTENVKKKGFLAMIWESMTKTGGCCGSGGCCCEPAKPEAAKAKVAPKAAGSAADRQEQGR